MQHLNGMCDQCTSYGGVHNKYGGKNRWLLSRLANLTCFAALAIEDLGSRTATRMQSSKLCTRCHLMIADLVILLAWLSLLRFPASTEVAIHARA